MEKFNAEQFSSFIKFSEEKEISLEESLTIIKKILLNDSDPFKYLKKEQ